MRVKPGFLSWNLYRLIMVEPEYIGRAPKASLVTIPRPLLQLSNLHGHLLGSFVSKPPESCQAPRCQRSFLILLVLLEGYSVASSL